MSKEKQIIEDMALAICESRMVADVDDCRKCKRHEDCLYQEIAYGLYNAGYRKQGEPKKPKFYDSKFRQRGQRYGEFVTIERAYNCPKCNCTVWETDKDNYCKHCGQPLDWSDTKGGAE